MEVLQVAVVGEDPVAAPQLAQERVAVFEQDMPLRRLADVRDRVARLDRITLDHFRERRARRRLMVDEQAAGLVLEERDAPAVSVMVGDAAARREAGEGERDVRRRGAVHSEKLAHGGA